MSIIIYAIIIRYSITDKENMFLKINSAPPRGAGGIQVSKFLDLFNKILE